MNEINFPIISVIVPVYKVEEYIEKCLKSIQQQTFKDFECLVVDDGTPDNSIQIAKKVVGDDFRFIFLKKTNGGPASARNYGLAHARGSYVAFVDSDDFVETTFLEAPYKELIATKADICMLSINYVTELGEIVQVKDNDLKGYYEKNDFLISKNTVTQFAGSKIYNKSVFDKIKFNEDIITYEDVYIMFKILYNKKIVNVNKPLYNYLQRSGTLSRDIKPTYLNDRLEIVKAQKQFLIENKQFTKFSKYFLFTYLKTFIGYCIVNFSLYSYNYKNDIDKLLSVIDIGSLGLKNILFMIKEERRVGVSLLLFKLSPNVFRWLIRIYYKNRIF